MDCGITYAAREYRMLPGASLGPTNFPIGMALSKPGYQGIAFIHDNGVISIVITRATTDRELAALRSIVAFEAATRAIPGLDVWTHPDRSRPISAVMVGAHLYNSYRGQLDGSGRLDRIGRIRVGDAVCTTKRMALPF